MKHSLKPSGIGLSLTPDPRRHYEIASRRHLDLSELFKVHLEKTKQQL